MYIHIYIYPYSIYIYMDIYTNIIPGYRQRERERESQQCLLFSVCKNGRSMPTNGNLNGDSDVFHHDGKPW